jgi:hypothetical protein
VREIIDRYESRLERLKSEREALGAKIPKHKPLYSFRLEQGYSDEEIRYVKLGAIIDNHWFRIRDLKTELSSLEARFAACNQLRSGQTFTCPGAVAGSDLPKRVVDLRVALSELQNCYVWNSPGGR